MDVTLVHNPSSGDENHSRERICALLEAHGHRVRYQSVEEPRWADGLVAPGGLVAVAGGDGTVADVMRVLAGSSAPMTVLPFGTANNVAASLGLAGRPVEELVAGWETGRQLRYFTGRVTGGGATSTFVEALGGGLCAAGIERAKGLEDDGNSLDVGLRALRELVDEIPAEPWAIDVDGSDASGSFLAVEVLLIALTGPSLPLAPTADPSDDLLDLVAVREADRNALRRHLDRRLAGEQAPAPPLAHWRVRCVELTPPPSAMLRLDDESWQPAGDVLVARTGAAVELLLP